MRTSRIIRKFERFLFKGIPEHPEHIWERDGNTYVSARETGKSQASSVRNDLYSDAKLIGTFKYDFEAQTETYTSNVKKGDN